MTEKNKGMDNREWEDIFYIETNGRYRYRRRKCPHPFRMSLLEFAIRHARCYDINLDLHTRIVALLLEYSHAHDAEMSVALQRSSAEVVQLLLRDWPDGKMILKSDLINCDEILRSELSLCSLLEYCQDIIDVGPLWYIANRSHNHKSHDAELIDLFVRRGEDINAQCSPVGTALHSALLHVVNIPVDLNMVKLLVAKGANINMSGPFGTPLEFLWRFVNTVGDFHIRQNYVTTTRWLIETGAVNNRCDPNGSIPSRERMLAFGTDGKEGFRKSRALYRGDPIEDENSTVRQTANA